MMRGGAHGRPASFLNFCALLSTLQYSFGLDQSPLNDAFQKSNLSSFWPSDHPSMKKR